MKAITIIHLDHCPYCKHAEKAVDALKSEHSKYQDITVTWLEESLDTDAIVALGQSYYYVPTIIANGQKVYEASPQDTYDSIYQTIKHIFEEAIQ